MKILITAFLLAGTLYGQAGKLGSPSLGYVFDPKAHALRRIQGIPGAALVGAAVDFGFTVSAVYVSPHLDSAFVIAGDRQAHFFSLSGDAPKERAVDSLGSPMRVVFSPSGSAAALYSPGAVQVVKGLPGAPVAAAAIPLHANPRPRRPLPDVLAISDDGAYLLYAAGGPLELIGAAGDNRQIVSGTPDTLAAFAPGGRDAAVIQNGKLTLFQDIAGAATQRSFDGFASASALAFSPDSRKLLVASATGQTVTTVQVATGERAALNCDCSPVALVPMGSVFRLNELGSGPLWLLDTASEAGLVFVPAPAAN